MTAIGAVCLAGAPMGASATTAAAATATIKVLVAGLDQPKGITVAPDGSLIVAVSGDGAAPPSCINGAQPECLDQSGAIDEVGGNGTLTTLLSGLPSISSGSTAGVAYGPAEARLIGGKLQVLFQDNGIDSVTGRQPFGPGGALLGDLAQISTSSPGSRRVEASFGPFEAAHNPDHSAGWDVAAHQEPAIDSDPYSFVPYRGGYAVADAGGNDLLFVSGTGRISVLAVFPTIPEASAPSSGQRSGKSSTLQAQAVPDALAVGPDGALYVGELGGAPSDAGSSRIYRVVPGHAATVYARGLTAVGALAFDRQGRLLVLEIDRRGLSDPALNSGAPVSGAIIRIAPGGRRTVIAASGLEFATGLAVGRQDTIYVATKGITNGNPSVPGSGGEIVEVTPG